MKNDSRMFKPYIKVRKATVHTEFEPTPSGRINAPLHRLHTFNYKPRLVKRTQSPSN